MRQSWKLLLSQCLLLFWMLWASSNALAANNTITMTLEGVSDGDTLYARTQNAPVTSYRIRLAMIDAPEKNQNDGTASKQALQNLVRASKTIEVEPHGFDRYGRMLAIVRSNGRTLNIEQVANGHAWVYSRYAKSPTYARYQKSLENALYNAQRQKLGLWKNANPTPPWDFRRGL